MPSKSGLIGGNQGAYGKGAPQSLQANAFSVVTLLALPVAVTDVGKHSARPEHKAKDCNGASNDTEGGRDTLNLY
jgi:hypothetical protein